MRTRMSLGDALILNAQLDASSQAYPCHFHFPIVPTADEVKAFEEANKPAISEPAKEATKTK